MKKTRTIVLIGILSALSFVLYFFEFPLTIFFPPYLKIDFSDVPAILGGIAAGPIVGTAIQLIKNILHFFLISKEPMASGEIGNFFAGIGFIIPVSLLIRRSMKNSFIAYFIGAISMNVLANVMNYFVALPLYGVPKEARIPTILYTLVPFNLVKAAIISIAAAVLFNRLKSVIVKNQKN
ncbi:MAG: hypothetical protein K0R31_2104 [Clostridiales bacterium]|jgi:riboflavin transporter FmnP|nr:hypothetical protein [Clostridiales bacterium]